MIETFFSLKRSQIRKIETKEFKGKNYTKLILDDPAKQVDELIKVGLYEDEMESLSKLKAGDYITAKNVSCKAYDGNLAIKISGVTIEKN